MKFQTRPSLLGGSTSHTQYNIINDLLLLLIHSIILPPKMTQDYIHVFHEWVKLFITQQSLHTLQKDSYSIFWIEEKHTFASGCLIHKLFLYWFRRIFMQSYWYVNVRLHNRDPTNGYFHYWLICWFFSINHLVWKTSANTVHWVSVEKNLEVKVIKCLALWVRVQKTKIFIYLYHYSVREGKAANSPIWETGTVKCLALITTVKPKTTCAI